MKKISILFIIIGLSLLMLACISIIPKAPTPQPVVLSPSPTITQTDSPTPAPSATPNLQYFSVQTPVPPTRPDISFVEPTFDTIPIGESVDLTEGDSSFTFRVKGVYIGKKTADKLAAVPVPEGMQLVLVVPEMYYSDGPAGKRAQLVHEDLFNVISKGHVLKNDLVKYTPPSNHLNSINLLPKETSAGYLVFAVYQDDTHPVLRYQNQGKFYYFALTLPVKPTEVTPTNNGALKQNTPTDTPQPTPTQTPTQSITWFGDQSFGDASHPVPLGKTIAYSWEGNTVLFSVDRTMRGLNAKKEIWNIGGSPAVTGSDQENIIAYLHIRLVQSSDNPLEIKPTLFNIYNQGQAVEKQPEIACPMPCLNNMVLYTNGQAQGWLPLITAYNDPQAVLSFNDEVFFTLEDPTQAQNPQAYHPVFSANAFGPDTIKNVQNTMAMQQNSVVQSLAFSPDDKWLASGSDDRKVHIWDVSTGKEVTTLGKYQVGVKSLSFSYDGKWLASVSDDGAILVWNTADWSLFQQLNQGGRGIFSGFLADNTLVTANQIGRISIWDVNSGTRLKLYLTQENVSLSCNDSRVVGFDTTFDGTTFAAALDCGYGVVWNPLSNERLVTDYNHAIDADEKPYISSISLSQVGGLSAYGAAYYDFIGYLVEIGDVERQVVLGGVGTATTNIPSISFSPNGEMVAAAIGPSVRTWWPNGSVWEGHKSVELQGHKAQVTAVKFSNDATLLASGDYLGNIIIWKAAAP